MKQLLFILFSFTLFFACNNEAKQTEPAPTNVESPEFKLSEKAAALYQVVVEKHDTAMLLTKDIARVQAQLRKVMEDNPRLKAVEEQVLEKLTPLRVANEGMTTWMNEFKNTHLNEDFYKKISEEETLEYLKSEEIKIELVHKAMLESIQNGETYVKSMQDKK